MSATAASTRHLGYRPGLDGLRAIAITFVVLHHTAAFLVPQWKTWFFTGGFLGVDIFFVLSGFLITSLLLERRGPSEPRPLRSFYARRALRLFPAVGVLVVANLVIAIIQSDGLGKALRSFLVVFTYTTNWAELRSVSFSPYLAHLWSLAIEEQFYFVWPILLLGALWAGLSRRAIAWLVLVLAAAAALWRAELWWSGHGWIAIYIRTDARADALLIGVVLGLARPDLLMSRVPRAVRGVLGCTALGLLVVAALTFHGDSKNLYLGGLTVVALIAALLLTVELTGAWPLHPVLSSRPLVMIGRLSYSLYLWHFLVFQVVAEHLVGSSSVLRVALGWSVTALAATASFVLVERPVLRVKDRLGRRRPKPVGMHAEPARDSAA
jgi:peptidoglycan/LPS O-acetylase OafA/YrhL